MTDKEKATKTETFVDRLIDEHNALAHRLTKLDAFIAGGQVRWHRSFRAGSIEGPTHGNGSLSRNSSGAHCLPSGSLCTMTDADIEKEIQAKGLTAPRITPVQIEAVIASEHYFTALDAVLPPAPTPEEFEKLQPLSLLTFCVLVLKNGFTVTGESACASPENFNAELGRKVARQHAVSKIWPLEGYLLRETLDRTAKLWMTQPGA